MEDGGRLGQWLWPDDLAPSLAGSFAGLCAFLILPVLGGGVQAAPQTPSLWLWAELGQWQGKSFSQLLETLPCFPGGSVVKSPAASAGDARGAGSTPGSGRPPGGGHGSPLQDSCLENPMDRGAWRAAVYGVAESDTTWQLNNSRGPPVPWFRPHV